MHEVILGLGDFFCFYSSQYMYLLVYIFLLSDLVLPGRFVIGYSASAWPWFDTHGY